MNRPVMLFATTLALSGLWGGCATTGNPIPVHAHAVLKADAMILVRGIT